MSARVTRLACTALAGAALVLPTTALAAEAPPTLPPAPPSLPAPGDLPAGPSLAPCLVPGLKGLTVAVASARLGRSGCRLGRVTRTAGSRARPGVIVAQGHAAGSALAGRSSVSVTVSSGRP